MMDTLQVLALNLVAILGRVLEPFQHINWNIIRPMHVLVAGIASFVGLCFVCNPFKLLVYAIYLTSLVTGQIVKNVILGFIWCATTLLVSFYYLLWPMLVLFMFLVMTKPSDESLKPFLDKMKDLQIEFIKANEVIEVSTPAEIVSNYITNWVTQTAIKYFIKSNTANPIPIDCVFFKMAIVFVKTTGNDSKTIVTRQESIWGFANGWYMDMSNLGQIY